VASGASTRVLRGTARRRGRGGRVRRFFIRRGRGVQPCDGARLHGSTCGRLVKRCCHRSISRHRARGPESSSHDRSASRASKRSGTVIHGYGRPILADLARCSTTAHSLCIARRVAAKAHLDSRDQSSRRLPRQRAGNGQLRRVLPSSTRSSTQASKRKQPTSSPDR